MGNFRKQYHDFRISGVMILLITGIFFPFGNTRLNAQGFIIYGDKTFGTTANEGGYCHFALKDALYIFGGGGFQINGDQTDSICDVSLSYNLKDYWLMKADLQWNKIWDRCIGGNRQEAAYHIFVNAQNQIILTGYSNSDSSCEKSENVRDTNNYSTWPPRVDYWIVAYDTSGNKLWDKTWGGIYDDDFPMTVQLTSGNYVTCGGSYSAIGFDKSVANWGGADYWCIKYDSAGNKIWDQVYGGPGGEYSSGLNYFVMADDNDAFVIAGTTSSNVGGNISQPNFNAPFSDIWIIKVDSSGNKVWDRRYGGNDQDNPRHICKVPDGYLVVGLTFSQQGGSVSQPSLGGGQNLDVWVLKLDTAGNKIWDRRYGGILGDLGGWGAYALDGGYLIGASTSSPAGNHISEPPYGNRDYWIFKIDTAGNILWDKRFGGPGSDGLYSFVQVADSSIYLFGTADSGTSAVKTDPGKGGIDYWIVHFKYVDAPVGILEAVHGTGHLYLFPNPATTHLTINYSPPKTTGRATVFNSTGSKVSEIILPKNTHRHQLDLSQYPSGLYLLKIETESYTGAKKFFKL